MAVGRPDFTRRATLSGLAAVGLNGMGRRANASPPLVFGVVIPSNDAQFYRRLLQGMHEAAASLGVELRMEYSKFDPRQEVEMIDQFVIAKVDGILVVPLGLGDPVAKVLVEKAEGAGVPVAAVVWPIPGAFVAVRPDWKAAGALQAQIAMSIALRAGQTRGTVLYLAGFSKYIGSDIVDVFQEVLAKNGFSVIVETLDVFDHDATVSVVAKALAAHPDVSIVAASDDILAQWADQAARAANRPIMAIGLGGSAEDFKETKLGRVFS